MLTVQFFLGPKSGKFGGEIVPKEMYMKNFNSNFKRKFFESKKTLRIDLNSDKIKFNDALKIRLGSLTGISSMSGVGKSTILREILPEKLIGYKYISQKPIRANVNSTVATYSGLFTYIKDEFAKNIKNYSFKDLICKKCAGKGKIAYLENYGTKIYEDCKYCNGSGFNNKILKNKFLGLNIYEILNSPIKELSSLKFPQKIAESLNILCKLRLDYLKLNTSILSLSGGENQRLKLFSALNDKKNEIYGLDEPTSGLDDLDIYNILDLLYEFIEKKVKLL